jgi:hypothetical protein
MILDGKLARTDVNEEGLFTPDGVQVGDSEARSESSMAAESRSARTSILTTAIT